jgi:type IV pilus assembly protein PilE
MLTNLKQSSAGFSLLEVVVVIVIIAILVAVAYPMYQNHVRETRRADAKSALVELAQLQERYYFRTPQDNTSTNHQYATDFNSLIADGLWGSSVRVDESGKTITIKSISDNTLYSREGYYQITFDISSGQKAFKFIAVPTTMGGQNNDNCKEFSIDNVGNKDSKSEPEGEKCW